MKNSKPSLWPVSAPTYPSLCTHAFQRVFFSFSFFYTSRSPGELLQTINHGPVISSGSALKIQPLINIPPLTSPLLLPFPASLK